MGTRFAALVSASVVSAACAGVARPHPSARAVYTTHAVNPVLTQVLCRLTGPAGIEAPPGLDLPLAYPTDGVGIDGTDLGIPFPWAGSWRLLFGDTDTNPARAGLYHQQDPTVWGPIEPNAMAVLPGPALDGCPRAVRWQVAGRTVAPVLPREDGEASVIFAGAATVGATVYAQAMSVGEWGPACDAPDARGNVCVRYGFLARSRDGGEHFERLPAPRWELPHRTFGSARTYTDAGFAQAALAVGEGPGGGEALWLFGAQSGRRGPLRLAWVPAGQVEDPRAYRYLSGLRDGAPEWSVDALEAVPVVPAPVGEASVAWLPSLRRWVLLRLDVRAQALVASLAPRPWGPWTAPVRVLDCGDSPWNGCYGGFSYGSEGPGGDEGRRFASADGRWLYFTVSHWGTYETYLARLSVDALAAAVAP